MKFYVTRSCSTQSGRKRINATVGEQVTQSRYNMFSPRLQQECFIPARNAPRNGDFTQQECDFLVTHYLTDIDQADLIQSFYQTFPNHRMNGGVECQLRIIAGQDNTTEDSGLDNPGRCLLKSLMTINPSRFV